MLCSTRVGERKMVAISKVVEIAWTALFARGLNIYIIYICVWLKLWSFQIICLRIICLRKWLWDITYGFIWPNKNWVVRPLIRPGWSYKCYLIITRLNFLKFPFEKIAHLFQLCWILNYWNLPNLMYFFYFSNISLELHVGVGKNHKPWPDPPRTGWVFVKSYGVGWVSGCVFFFFK